jgi:hypothetical protein
MDDLSQPQHLRLGIGHLSGTSIPMARCTIGTTMNTTNSSGRGHDAEAISEDQCGERHLWIAVPAKAVEDWSSANLRLRDSAQVFLFDSDRDLESVCSRAGLNLAYLRARLLRIRPPPNRTQGSTPYECLSARPRLILADNMHAFVTELEWSC